MNLCSLFIHSWENYGITLFPNSKDRDSFYEGRVFGEDDSDVRAHLEDNGVMTATIRTRNETYHIEVIIGVKYLCLIQFNLINVYFAEL